MEVRHDSAAVTPVRRPLPVVLLHWATLLLIGVLLSAIFVREGVEARALRALLINVHKSAGVLVLVTAALRLFVRVLGRPQAATDDHPPLVRWLAGATHGLLYVLMFALPVLGWALSNAQGHPVSVFGFVTLPNLVQEDEDLSDLLGEAHETAAWALIGLVVLHAGAALWHHFVRRDNTLRAMLPAFSGTARS